MKILNYKYQTTSKKTWFLTDIYWWWKLILDQKSLHIQFSKIAFLVIIEFNIVHVQYFQWDSSDYI